MRNCLVLLCLFSVGCNPLISGPTNLHEVALSTLAAVDAVEDVADLPKIPDTLRDYKAEPPKKVEILPAPKVEPKPTPKPEPTPAPAKEVEKPKPKEATPPAGVINTKPVVYCYTGEGCPPCKQAKDWWESVDKSTVPFRLEFRSDHPEWVQFVPVFHWEFKGKWYSHTGFSSGEQLVGTWKRSGEPVAVQQAPEQPVQTWSGGGCASGMCGGGRRR